MLVNVGVLYGKTRVRSARVPLSGALPYNTLRVFTNLWLAVNSRWGNIVLPSWRETVSLRLGLRPGGVRIRLPLRCLVAEIAQPGFRITRMALRHPRGHFPLACDPGKKTVRGKTVTYVRKKGETEKDTKRPQSQVISTRP